MGLAGAGEGYCHITDEQSEPFVGHIGTAARGLTALRWIAMTTSSPDFRMMERLWLNMLSQRGTTVQSKKGRGCGLAVFASKAGV